jgi:hypothetical protein
MTDVTAGATSILAQFADIRLEQDPPQPVHERASESARSQQVPNQPPRHAGVTP